MSTDPKHILEVDSVEFSSNGQHILSGAYLSAETGSVTVLLGNEGTGRSELLSILADFLKAESASIHIDGVWRKRLTNLEVCCMPRQNFVPWWITPEHAMRDSRVAWNELLKYFPRFDDLRRQKIRSLSVGDRRLLECFLVLYSPARFLLMDEPLLQIEPADVVVLLEIICQKKDTKGILLSSSKWREILPVADRIFVMHNGQSHFVRNEEDLMRQSYLAQM